MESLHAGPYSVAGLSHSDGELWHNFFRQETHTRLLLLSQGYI